jgi:hypothetical protein
MEESGQTWSPNPFTLVPLKVGLMGPRAGLDDLEKKKIPSPYRNWRPMLAAVWTTLSRMNMILSRRRLKDDSHIACPAHAVLMPRPCRAAKGLECVFPTWFTQCGHVWFTLAMPCSDNAFLLKATAQHGRRETAVLWPWEERHDRSMAWAWHGKCESDTAALCK